MRVALARWRKPTATHDPAEVVLDLAVTLALGGDCLAEIALLRGPARGVRTRRVRPDGLPRGVNCKAVR